MKGTFKITLEYLKELGACRDGQRKFQKAFPDGGEYQEVLDRCADEGHIDFGVWLLSHIGRTEDVRTYNEIVDAPEKNIIFAGRIEFKFGIKANCIIAGCGIEAGDDFCVFAGLRICKGHWEASAVVSAKVEPKNLMSGFWRPRYADETHAD